MGLTLLTGGARSGKSSLALRLVSDAGPVTFVATAEAGDDDMAHRIEAHRAERPAGWTTLEVPRALSDAVADVTTPAVVVDCLTLWTTNLLLDEVPDDVVVAEAIVVAELLAAIPTAVVVTNEVGLGIVPADALSRRYRDLLGRVNAAVAARADRVLLCVAGRAVDVPPLPAVVTQPPDGGPR